jgi:cell division protease FtsH
MAEQKPKQQPNKSNKNNPKQPKKSWLSWLYYALAFGLLLMFFAPMDSGKGANKDLSYTKFTAYINNDAVASVVVYDDNTAKAKIRPESYALVFGNQEAGEDVRGELKAVIPTVEEFAKYIDGVNLARKEQGKAAIDVSYAKSKGQWWMIALNAFPFLLLVLFFVWMSRGMANASNGGPGGIFNVGKAKAQVFDKDKKGKVTFKDVAGLAGAKQEVEEIVSFLKEPTKYTNLGGKIPKGVLLVGPPGTGKTLLAKAVAGEANVPFFSMSGSDFVEMFVGVGASRVRDLFRQAKEKAPAIVFIDEIDAVGRARGRNNMMGGGNDERESTLNQLLTEMDGFGSNSGVIVLAATNRADVLDSALLRAGRFDRQIHVELPDLQERKEIFGVHLAPIKLDDSIDVNFLAKQTPGFSGADIANVCNEAALIAARNNHKAVTKQDFMDAVDRIIGGLERKNKIMTEEEKRSVAYHEAGHATISWLLRWANPLVKVTIVPRGVALGAAWYLPEERQLTNKEHIMDNLCSLLGGRAAEEVFLKQTSTGALNDLERATKQAYAMVAYYGMSDKLKNMSYYDSTGRYDMGITKPYSEKTAEVIDAETAAIIAEQMARAKKILEENAEGHNKLAELLIEKEVITSEDVEAILGARPWTSRTDELIEANEASKANKQEGDEVKVEKKKRAPRKKKEAVAPAEEPAASPESEQTAEGGPTANSETI